MKNGARLAPVDVATVLYIVAVTAAMLLVTHGSSSAWGPILIVHGLGLALIALVAQARARGGRMGQWIGTWYPLFLFPALYLEVGVLNLDIGRNHDLALQRLEQSLFGAQWSYLWIREMPSALLSSVLHLCYLSYYLILLAAPMGLWLSGRREAARVTIFGIVVTFYVCYLTFVLFPVAGPRYTFALADNAATRVWPARFTQWLLNQGDSWGAAFPSSHVAGALVATACALRFWRPLGLALLPLTIGLTLGVVYGQFHYAVDALAGVLVGVALMLSISLEWGDRWAREMAMQPPSAADLESPAL